MQKTHMLFEEDQYKRQASARVALSNDEGIVLDATVFYPVGGGQPGDQGHLLLPDGRELRIVDTVRSQSNPFMIVHIPEQPITLPPGMEVMAHIDWERRYRHMRMHTCLHLLCAVVRAPVTGCGISADKGRLDFDLPEPTVDKEAITEQLNALIGCEIPVHTRWVDEKELESSPRVVSASSINTPQYDRKVRLVEVQGIDVQPCGGTHVSNTAEIGIVRCQKIEKKSRHNRRIVVEFNDAL
ncbi:MAG: alanyl-tRNA editing protein [Gammaproteobacteria bacterium]